MIENFAYQSLNQSIRALVSISDEELAAIHSFFHIRRHNKKEVLLQEGSMGDGLFFLIRGCTINYIHGDLDAKHVLNIHTEGWWLGNLGTIVLQQPSRYNIMCLEDSEFLWISNDDYVKLLAEIPIMEKFFRILAQRGLVALQHRVLDNLSKDATTRYLEFRQKNSKLEGRVSLRIIASYLGITPEFLSMIRARLAKVQSVNK